MNSIEDLNRRIAELTALYEPLQQELYELKQRLLEEKSPFKLGQVIKWRGKIGRVIRVISWCNEPAWKVIRIKKDGSDGCECEVWPYYAPKLL